MTHLTSSTTTRVSTHALSSMTKKSSTEKNVPAATTKSSSVGGAGNNNRRGPNVPVVCAGKTSDTFKLTTTPAADHDPMTMCTDTKRTGMRTNPSVIQPVPHTPPADRTTTTTTTARRKSLAEPSSPLTTTHHQQEHTASFGLLEGSLHVHPTAYTEASHECQAVLLSKLKWCTRELEKSESLEYSILVCRLVKSAGEALKTLQELPLSSAAPRSGTTDHSSMES